MSHEKHEEASARDSAAWQRHLAHRATNNEQLITELEAGSLPEAALASAHDHPDRPALLFPADSQRWLTHGELADRSARTGSWLIGQGMRPGARVLLCGHNTAVLVTAYLAVLRCGATVVLANPAYTADELAHLVTDSGAEWAIAAHPATELLADMSVRVLPLDEPLPEAEPTTLPGASSQDLAMLAYTSGTTGAPKGVPLTHGNLLSSIRAAMLAWQWANDDVLVHSLPLSHQHGLGGIHATLLAGSSAVILPRFEPGELARAILVHSATVLFAVPAIYDRMVAEKESTRALASPTLRLAVSGSAPLDPALAEQVAEVMGTPPLERYGSTETGLNVSNPLEGPRVTGFVGLGLPGVELRVADDSGTEVPIGSAGEVLLRGPQVCAGYWNRPDATAEAFHPDGWFRTGDIGRIDERNGYLTITGRKKELIITGGLNVYPREVELALEKHPAIAQAAVAGLPSQRWGEQVTAWIVPSEQQSATADEVIEHARRMLAAYKCPKQIFYRKSLPRNSMGKLRRSALVDEATSDAPDTTALDRAVAKLWEVQL